MLNDVERIIMSKSTPSSCPAVRGYHYTEDETFAYLFKNKKSLELDGYSDDPDVFKMVLPSVLQEVVRRTKSLDAECYDIDPWHPSYDTPLGEVTDESIAVCYIIFEDALFEVDLSGDPSYQDLRKKYTESWEQENPPDSLGLPFNPPCVLWLDPDRIWCVSFSSSTRVLITHSLLSQVQLTGNIVPRKSGERIGG